MRHIVMRRALLAGLVLALACVASWSDTPPAAGGGAYASAKICGECHTAIHAYWSESAHARAAVTPSYLASLDAAVAGADDKDQVRRGCVSCHAPTTLVTGDLALAQPLSKEGVTCDFCHTVADVDLHQAQPFDLKPGHVKRGPLQYAESPFHGTEYSPLHKSSPLLCAGCHEYRNAAGVAVLSTYSEWSESSYPARGMPCQECHMPLVPGSTVREGLKASERMLNLHRLVGGSSVAKVRSGIDLRLDVSRGGTAADVQVVVTNSGVGHAAPGGLATKALVLAVGVESARGELLHRRERVYRRSLLDAHGQVLWGVGDLFLKSASVGEDTRLQPKESRSERFTVPLPEGAQAIVARLEYRDASDPTSAPRTTLILEERHAFSGR